MYLKEPLLPTTKIYKSTFKLFYKKETGSSFVINFDKRQFLVSAKHIFKDCISGQKVDLTIINEHNAEISIKSKIYFHKNELIDIAIIPIDLICNDTLEIKDPNSAAIGQECLFLGFPLYDFLKTEHDIGSFALVKKAILSGRVKLDNGVYALVLDGHNNPGFSGGPIITHNDLIENTYIVGVISGYYIQKDKNKFSIGETNNYFKEVEVEINTNSGIIISYDTDYIKEIIKEI